MKLIDKILRKWRVHVALQAMPHDVNRVFDIGCDDGYLLKYIDNGSMQLDGCDPRLSSEPPSPRYNLFRGPFPAVLEKNPPRGPYDSIFALAVFEHFTAKDLADSSQCISEMLSEQGVLIVTVPHPYVDKILDILSFLKMIDGQALEEHHAFNPESLVSSLETHLRLISRRTFQLGLNNLFVFKKRHTHHNL